MRSDPVNLDSIVAITLLMRASQRAQEYGAKLLSGDKTPLSRDEAEEITSPDPEDRQAVLAFVTSRGLHVTSEDARSRKVCVTGTVIQMNVAFGVRMRTEYDALGRKYLGYTGRVKLPEELQAVIEAVLGLDGRPVSQGRAGVINAKSVNRLN